MGFFWWSMCRCIFWQNKFKQIIWHSESVHLTQWKSFIETWIKSLTFCRRHNQMGFRERRASCFGSNFTPTCSQCSNWVQMTINHHCLGEWLDTDQATSHYLNQRWQSSPTLDDVIRLQWVTNHNHNSTIEPHFCNTLTWWGNSEVKATLSAWFVKSTNQLFNWNFQLQLTYHLLFETINLQGATGLPTTANTTPNTKS